MNEKNCGIGKREKTLTLNQRPPDFCGFVASQPDFSPFDYPAPFNRAAFKANERRKNR